VEIVKGKKSFELGPDEFRRLISGYSRFALDIGTGDGRFVYKSAQANPTSFYVGIDPARENLAEYSARIYKKPQRGGLPNALYIIASAENLPPELDGLAQEVYINYPWGSLLKAVVEGDLNLLANIVRVSRPAASLEILINYSLFTDPVPLEVQELPELTFEYIDDELAARYAGAGITIVERSWLDKEEMQSRPSTWGKRLAHGRLPRTFCIRAEIKRCSILSNVSATRIFAPNTPKRLSSPKTPG
jgi:16S rRNA (adenine(1408)-N(1))-methyltransferase